MHFPLAKVGLHVWQIIQKLETHHTCNAQETFILSFSAKQTTLFFPEQAIITTQTERITSLFSGDYITVAGKGIVPCFFGK